jgi:hypothetical protein
LNDFNQMLVVICHLFRSSNPPFGAGWKSWKSILSSTVLDGSLSYTLRTSPYSTPLDYGRAYFQLSRECSLSIS